MVKKMGKKADVKTVAKKVVEKAVEKPAKKEVSMKQAKNAKGEDTKSLKGDVYGKVSNEYDNEYKRQGKANSFDQLNGEIYNKEETNAVKTPLDGQAITKEIGGKKLS
jgi:uncharacterized membrane protein YheB (UPF0754 family)